MIGKNLRRNNAKTALNILYAKKEKIYPAYIWKHNSNPEKQVILIMIPNREKLWHYLAAKKSPFLKEITSKHYCDFYCLNCCRSFGIKNKSESHKRVCENKDFFKHKFAFWRYLNIWI